jgi:ubiquinone/menaquinone biosynthesis C-methylase UbiE
VDLKRLQANWNAFGEIDGILERVSGLEIPVRRGRALDFGCGVGRLTQGLCRHFDECCGVDIAPSMIELARAHNHHGARCRYEVNPAADLRLFADDTFDFIYSSLVLQHMRPRYAKRYIPEFLRILAPGGCMAFRLPSQLRQPLDRVRSRIGRLYWVYRDCLAAAQRQPAPPRMEMNGVLRPQVEKLITRHGGVLQAVCDDRSAGPDWVSISLSNPLPNPGSLD